MRSSESKSTINERIARAAHQYVKDHIKKSSAELKANDLTTEQHYQLHHAVGDVRRFATNLWKEHTTDVPSDYSSLNKVTEELIGIDPEGSYFTKGDELIETAELLKKYSLGNCHELAQLGLYYVLTEAAEQVDSA